MPDTQFISSAGDLNRGKKGAVVVNRMSFWGIMYRYSLKFVATINRSATNSRHWINRSIDGDPDAYSFGVAGGPYAFHAVSLNVAITPETKSSLPVSMNTDWRHG